VNARCTLNTVQIRKPFQTSTMQYILYGVGVNIADQFINIRTDHFKNDTSTDKLLQ